MALLESGLDVHEHPPGRLLLARLQLRGAVAAAIDQVDDAGDAGPSFISEFPSLAQKLSQRRARPWTCPGALKQSEQSPQERTIASSSDLSAPEVARDS